MAESCVILKDGQCHISYPQLIHQFYPYENQMDPVFIYIYKTYPVIAHLHLLKINMILETYYVATDQSIVIKYYILFFQYNYVFVFIYHSHFPASQYPSQTRLTIILLSVSMSSIVSMFSSHKYVRTCEDGLSVPGRFHLT